MNELHDAVRANQLEEVRKLLQGGLFIDTRDSFLYTPLHISAAIGYVDITKLLLEYGAEVNAQGQGGVTPTQLAKHAIYWLEKGVWQDNLYYNPEICNHAETIAVLSRRMTWVERYCIPSPESENISLPR